MQVFGEWGEVDALAQHVTTIGGRLCGKEPRMRVFSIPLSAGLLRIETTIDDIVSDWPNLTWMFGNVSTVDLRIDNDDGPDGGEVLHEPVRAFDEGGGIFTLATSPLLASGVASGDRIRISADGSSEVLEPSGAVAVQVFGDWELEFFVSKVEDLGGRFDGAAGDQVAVFTFEAQDDGADPNMSAIQKLFGEHGASGDGRTWRIANP